MRITDSMGRCFVLKPRLNLYLPKIWGGAEDAGGARGAFNFFAPVYVTQQTSFCGGSEAGTVLASDY